MMEIMRGCFRTLAGCLLVCLSDFGEIMTKARSQYLHMIIPI